MTDAEIDARFLCLDCSVDTAAIDEYYMVTDEVWAAGGVSPEDGMLCIGCLEKRLGRVLVPADFTPCLLNRVQFGRFSRRSPRLSRRLGYIAQAAA